MSDEMQPAMTSRIITYMAIFKRLFVAAQEAYAANDPALMVMVGRTAYALHNVPRSLPHLPDEGCDSWKNQDEVISNYPQVMVEREAQPRVVDKCRAIVSFEGAADELGLSPTQLTKIGAPPEELNRYLGIVYWALIWMRTIAVPESWTEEGWASLNDHWSPGAAQTGRFNALLAAAIQDVPRGLVTWTDFDRAGFRRKANRWARDVHARDLEKWARLFGLRGCLALVHVRNIPLVVRFQRKLR